MTAPASRRSTGRGPLCVINGSGCPKIRLPFRPQKRTSTPASRHDVGDSSICFAKLGSNPEVIINRSSVIWFRSSRPPPPFVDTWHVPASSAFLAFPVGALAQPCRIAVLSASFFSLALAPAPIPMLRWLVPLRISQAS